MNQLVSLSSRDLQTSGGDLDVISLLQERMGVKSTIGVGEGRRGRSLGAGG